MIPFRMCVVTKLYRLTKKQISNWENDLKKKFDQNEIWSVLKNLYEFKRSNK